MLFQAITTWIVKSRKRIRPVGDAQTVVALSKKKDKELFDQLTSPATGHALLAAHFSEYNEFAKVYRLPSICPHPVVLDSGAGPLNTGVISENFWTYLDGTFWCLGQQ